VIVGSRVQLGPLSALLAAIYPGRSFPPVVALTAYLDDSKGGDIFVLAGYLARAEEWEPEFAYRWQGVLDNAPHPLAEFKAGDCRHGTGEFRKNWTKEQRHSLTKRCVDLLVSRPVIAVGFGVVGSAVRDSGPFQDVNPRSVRDPFAGIHYAAFSGFLCLLLRLAEEVYEVDKIRIVCDKQPGLECYLRRVFELTMAYRPELERRIGSPLFEHSDEVLPLQAADLIAHETYKEVKSRREKPSRKVSIALERLVSGGRGASAVYLDDEWFSRRETGVVGQAKTIYGEGRVVRGEL